MSKLFESVFGASVDFTDYFVVLLVAIVLGFLITIVSKYRSTSTKSFFITTSLLPAIISMIIMLVNGNIGAGVAVAGAFSLVRFRSATGSAKEIVIIFIDMAVGLSLGMGYIGYAVIFSIVVLAVFFVLSNTKVLDEKKCLKDMKLKIVVPEQLDYTNEFKGIFNEYLEKYELLKVKSSLMGSVFNLSYDVTFKNPNEYKKFIDSIRCKNSNLEVLLEKQSDDEKDL